VPTYQFRCPLGHEQERNFKFGKKPGKLRCECGRFAARVITYPQHILFRGPGFTTGGYDYEEEMRTGRDFEAERERRDYEKNQDELDEVLDEHGFNPYEDKLDFTRTTTPPDAV